MHRHDVGARELPMGGSSSIVAVATRHEQYFKPFRQADELETGHRFWMRFRTSEDLADWCSLIAAQLPTVVSRARDLPAHEFILGEPLDWP